MNDDEKTEPVTQNIPDSGATTEGAVVLPGGGADAARPSGDDLLLSDREIDDILATRQSKFIVLIGGVKSGKTSLLASIFHGLLGGEFAGQRFAYSASLPAFARMLWYITVQSRQRQGDLPRTIRAESYAGVHLRLRGEAAVLQELVFTDISGEIYDDARHSPEGASLASYIARADAVGLLLDGAKVSNPELRDVDYNELSIVVKRLQDCGYLSSVVPTAVIFTKVDLWKASPDLCEIADHYYKKLVKDRGFVDARRIDTASLSSLLETAR